jgi:hypothetical protein
MGQCVGIADVELGVLGEHTIRQKVTELGLGPPVHDAVDDAVQVGARVDVVRDARGDNRQDIACALAAFVDPGEEPMRRPRTKFRRLSFKLASIVGSLDIPISRNSRSRRHWRSR